MLYWAALVTVKVTVDKDFLFCSLNKCFRTHFNSEQEKQHMIPTLKMKTNGMNLGQSTGYNMDTLLSTKQKPQRNKVLEH